MFRINFQIIIFYRCGFQTFVINGPITGSAKPIAAATGVITEGKYSSDFSNLQTVVYKYSLLLF